jgi:hypothetical protein
MKNQTPSELELNNIHNYNIDLVNREIYLHSSLSDVEESHDPSKRRRV